MKTPEELAKETLQKKLKFSPDTWTDCHTCFVYGYDAAKPEWISVKERLPEEGVEVLVFDNGVISTKSISTYTHEWHLYENGFDCDPSHWMPLPEAPKEDK